MKRILLILCGCLSLAIGVAGIVLPLIPTTPLLLLAGACFARSSERFHHWLRKTKMYQIYVADFVEKKAISRTKKKKILAQIYLLMGLSIFLAPLWPIKLLLIGLTAFLTYFLYWKIPED